MAVREQNLHLSRCPNFRNRLNRYRLVVGVNYRMGLVFVKWLGTHGEYDKIDVGTVEYEPEAD